MPKSLHVSSECPLDSYWRAASVTLGIMQHIVIDVREPAEYATGHVTGASNIPLDQLVNGPAQLVDLPKDSSIIVYCRTGSRSNVAMNILNSLGYTNVTNGINKEQLELKYEVR